MPFPLSISYPTTFHPSFWGPPTGNTNFCELDHQFSPYIAELINTLSNVTYLLYAYHGLRSLYRRGRLSTITAMPHIGGMCVGLGSIAFHATLLKVPQLADEIGMAVPTGAVLARLVSFDVQDPTRQSLAYWAAVAAVVAVYVLHCVSFSNWIHYPAFGLMVFFIGRRCIWLIRRIEDVDARRKVRRQVRNGEILFVGAFGLWLVDRLCCNQLIAAREWLGLPWGWLLELHGWWHLGTGMGAFVFIQVAEFLTEEGGGQGDPGDRLDPWKLRLWGGDDDVVGKTEKRGKGSVDANGSQRGNGHVKAGKTKTR